MIAPIQANHYYMKSQPKNSRSNSYRLIAFRQWDSLV